VLSNGGQRDGEDVWDMRDSQGNQPIQEICRKAVTLSPGQVATHRYVWQNSPQEGTYSRIVRLKCFKDWDWGIGVSVPEPELYEAAATIGQISHSGVRSLIVVALAAVAASCGIWLFLAKGLTPRTRRIIQELSEAAGAISSAAAQVAANSQDLAREAQAQAASDDSVASSLDRMEGMAQQSQKHSTELKRLAADARSSAEDGSLDVQSLIDAMSQIQSAGADVVKANKIIDRIALQTNILALNAAVEAARAGEAGLGFAVVAEEARNLSHRCAEAAQETSEKIRKSMSAGEQGGAVTRQVAEKLRAIALTTRQLDELAHSLATTSEQQT
jgi:methyl-accepting chemotaxis protein